MPYFYTYPKEYPEELKSIIDDFQYRRIYEDTTYVNFLISERLRKARNVFLSVLKGYCNELIECEEQKAEASRDFAEQTMKAWIVAQYHLKVAQTAHTRATLEKEIDMMRKCSKLLGIPYEFENMQLLTFS